MHLPSVSSIALVATSLSMVSAHMMLSEPAPLKGQHNPHTQSADYSMTSPLEASGADFPCKGYNKLLGTPEGASVATWAAGSPQKFSVTGGASHGGGSCQASLSYDSGKIFNVIKSYIGNCPTSSGGSFDFTVPADAPSNPKVLFAWTWFNNIGNREMYMNCASVSITGGKGKDLSSLPQIFVANVGDGCTTQDSTDVLFPNPGKDVVNDSKKTAPPSGASCGKATPGAAGGNSTGSGGAAQSSGAPAGAAAGAGQPNGTQGGSGQSGDSQGGAGQGQSGAGQSSGTQGGADQSGGGAGQAGSGQAAAGNNGMYDPSLYGGGAAANYQATSNPGMYNPSLYGGPSAAGAGAGAQSQAQGAGNAKYAVATSPSTLETRARPSQSVRGPGSSPKWTYPYPSARSMEQRGLSNGSSSGCAAASSHYPYPYPTNGTA